MIFFIIASGAPPAVAATAPRLSDALASCSLIGGKPVIHVAPSGTWALVAASAPDALSDGARHLVDGDDMVVMNGAAFAVDGNQSGVMRTLLREFRSRGSQGVTDALTGSFNFVGISRTQGLCALVDWTGLCPLYWSSNGDVAVLSNRSVAVERTLGNVGWDADALAWIISHVNLVGDRVPARGVRYVPPGFEASAPWGAPGVRIEKSPSWLWSAPTEGRENLTAGEWDAVTEELVEHTRLISAVSAPLMLGITGGKDSRLCLALARAAGLSDRVTAYNGGGPEADLAQRVAEAADFEFRRGREPVDQSQLRDVPALRGATAIPGNAKNIARWNQLNHSIRRYEAIVGAWSALQNPIASSFVEIKGWGGEFFRRGNDKRFRHDDPSDVDELIRMLCEEHRALDQLQVVPREICQRQLDSIASWTNTNASDLPLGVLPEKFYVDFRLGHWSGPNLQCTPANVTLNPLACHSPAIKNLELSTQARASERFHYEVMRRAAPALVALPFYQDGWAGDIVASSPVPIPGRSPAARRPPQWRVAAARVRRPFRNRGATAAPAARSTNPGWKFLDDERDAIVSLFNDAKAGTEIASICEVDRIIDLARTSEPIRQLGAARQLTNSIGIALALLATDR